MKKTSIKRTLMIVLTLALTIGLLGAYGTAQAAVDSVTITYTGSLTLPVGATQTLKANPVRSGTTTDTPVYSWTKGNDNVDLTPVAEPTEAGIEANQTCVVKAMKPGTSVVTVGVTDGETSTGKTANVTITVSNASITGAPTSAMTGGATAQLYVNGVHTDATNVWAVKNYDGKVVTVSSTGLVTAVGAGTERVEVTSTYNEVSTTAYVDITVKPTITLTPSSANITTAGGKTSYTLQVSYGGILLPEGTAVEWKSSNTWIATVKSSTDSIDASGKSVMEVTANDKNEGEVTITAKINGTDYTATLQVRTQGYFKIAYDPTNKLTKDGATITRVTYTRYLADGTVDTSYNGYASWSWTTNLLALSTNSINSYRHQFNNGVATIELQSRGYNTRTSGTPVYAWIDGYKSTTRLSTQLYISGYASTPQTGQDFTMIYVLGACCLAVAAVWVIWYAKKRRTAAR